MEGGGGALRGKLTPATLDAGAGGRSVGRRHAVLQRRVVGRGETRHLRTYCP